MTDTPKPLILYFNATPGGEQPFLKMLTGVARALKMPSETLLRYTVVTPDAQEATQLLQDESRVPALVMIGESIESERVGGRRPGLPRDNVAKALAARSIHNAAVFLEGITVRDIMESDRARGIFPLPPMVYKTLHDRTDAAVILMEIARDIRTISPEHHLSVVVTAVKQACDAVRAHEASLPPGIAGVTAAARVAQKPDTRGVVNG